MEIAVGPPVVSVHSDDEVVVSGASGDISNSHEHGYFVSDTRLVSGHRVALCGEEPVLLNGSATGNHSARFELTNPRVLGPEGDSIGEHTLHLRLDRVVSQGVHEDYDLTNWGPEPVVCDLEIAIESDFADIFDVKAKRRVRRGTFQTSWDQDSATLTTRYANGEFERAVAMRARCDSPEPRFANGRIEFRIALRHGESWHSCLYWIPIVHGEPRPVDSRCHQLRDEGSDRSLARREWIDQTTEIDTSNPVVNSALRQSVEDLAGLRLHRHDQFASGGGSHDGLDRESWVPAAGVPWFLSLFGRDSLTVSEQTLALSPRFALGSLRALANLQAGSYDDDRDMQPGKIEHEIRHGELAELRLVPHSPYYGAHETTTLYVLVAAHAYWWHGSRDELDAMKPHVERALAWIDRDGDPDHDGLQEYQTRARDGYVNQGWKDSGDAIVDEDGSPAATPIALAEHQGAVVAAKRAWADVLEGAYRDRSASCRLRSDADRLAETIEARFWWEEQGTYVLGLDGRKRPIRSVASNAGHLLWQRAVAEERAARVVERLMADDMWSGWGIRTLSSGHPAYNPLSYQRGSVWPHDNGIIAAGFRNYGFDGAAGRVARGILDATSKFAAQRPPELFAGLSRDPGSFPVQYLGANVPQAWSSGAIVHLLVSLLGLEANAPAGKLLVRPALPEWLAEVTLCDLRVGDGSADVRITRVSDGPDRVDVLRAEGLRVDSP